MAECYPLNCILLCGGQSSRMGCPKYAMLLDGKSAATRLVDRIREAHPSAETIYISLHDRSQSVDSLDGNGFYYLYDEQDRTLPDSYAGPAAGLLAAYHLDRTAHWLVVACDYPLISAADLRQLIENYESPITCFENAQGWPEPLLAVWSPAALQNLEENVCRGKTGPIKVVEAVSTKRLKPQDERSLMNTNTPAEWEAALRAAGEVFGS